LIYESWDHSGNWGRGPDTSTVGASDSKGAAVAAASNYETNYGLFDAAVDDMFGEEGDYLDNRENPPDNGVLMQLGSRDSGEGDYERFSIKMVDIQGLGPQKKKTTKQSSKKTKAPKQPSKKSAAKKSRMNEDEDDGGKIIYL
jgi:hypothetical protein